MASLTIELPTQREQTAFNLRRWSELLTDPALAKIEGRIETDRYGHIIMSPPPAPSHGSYQTEIAHLLREAMDRGRVISECPISTADGVKAADVVWASPESMRNLGNRACFPQAPELCVEILSPSNSQQEIDEKKSLYLDAGAKEVWICSRTGAMRFYQSGSKRPTRNLRLFPAFPKQVKLS